MTANFSGGGGGGLDYVQPDKPDSPKVGEEWFDTDADPDGDGTNEGEVKVYGSDGNWYPTGYIDHRNLTNIAQDNHHSYPVPTAGIATDAVTGSEIASDAVDTAQIVADAVTNALIAADAVDSAQIATDAVDTARIAADSVTKALIASGAVDSGQIATDAVGNSEIATDAVDSGQIATDAVRTYEIATDAVGSTEIANNSVDTARLSFDPATQSELNNHAGDSNAHHSKYDPNVVASGSVNTYADLHYVVQDGTDGYHSLFDESGSRQAVLTNSYNGYAVCHLRNYSGVDWELLKL